MDKSKNTFRKRRIKKKPNNSTKASKRISKSAEKDSLNAKSYFSKQ